MLIPTAAFGIASSIRCNPYRPYCIQNLGSHSRRNALQFHSKPIKMNKDAIDDDSSHHHTQVHSSDAENALLQLVQSHFVAQTLLAFVRLGVPDVLTSSNGMTIDEIIDRLEERHPHIERGALFRCLRLLCTARIVNETTTTSSEGGTQSAFLLTDMGKLLQTTSDSQSSISMAPFVHHWMEKPLWDAWSHLPDYLSGNNTTDPPFDVANGLSASEYYTNNTYSALHRNAVARYASSKEITSILDAILSNVSSHLNEKNLREKTIVEVGGGYGDFMMELKKRMPTVGTCHCLDLQNVIRDAEAAADSNAKESAVTLVAGDMFNHKSIPQCDVIFTKHVICDFSDTDVVRAMNEFHKVLSPSGKLVIMDAVLPNGDELNGKWNATVSFDVLLMLSGRRGERSRLEWSNLGREAGFLLEEVVSTESVTVDLAIFSKK